MHIISVTHTEVHIQEQSGHGFEPWEVHWEEK